MPDDPTIAKLTPRTGYVHGEPDTLSDLAALTALWSCCVAVTAYNEQGRQVVADAYAHLARRLGIEEGNTDAP